MGKSGIYYQGVFNMQVQCNWVVYQFLTWSKQAAAVKLWTAAGICNIRTCISRQCYGRFLSRVRKYIESMVQPPLYVGSKVTVATLTLPYSPPSCLARTQRPSEGWRRFPALLPLDSRPLQPPQHRFQFLHQPCPCMWSLSRAFHNVDHLPHIF